MLSSDPTKASSKTGRQVNPTLTPESIGGGLMRGIGHVSAGRVALAATPKVNTGAMPIHNYGTTPIAIVHPKYGK